MNWGLISEVEIKNDREPYHRNVWSHRVIFPEEVLWLLRTQERTVTWERGVRGRNHWAWQHNGNVPDVGRLWIPLRKRQKANMLETQDKYKSWEAREGERWQDQGSLPWHYQIFCFLALNHQKCVLWKSNVYPSLHTEKKKEDKVWKDT